MKWPLGIVAALYAGGLILGNYFQPPLPCLFAVALSFAAAALLLSRFRSFLLWPLIVLTGWTNMVWHTAVVSPNDLRALLGNQPELASIRGTLVAMPTERVYVNDEGQITIRTMARVDVTAIQRRETNWQVAVGRIAVVNSGELPEDFFAGREVQIDGVLAPPPGPLADGLFDFRNYLRRQEIYFEVKTHPADWQLVNTNKIALPLSDRFMKWAKVALALGVTTNSRGADLSRSGSGERNPTEGGGPRGPSERERASQFIPRNPARGQDTRNEFRAPITEKADPDTSLRLEQAITLGDKTYLTEDVAEPFIRASTYHIFAVDGLRMAIIFGIFFTSFRMLRIPRTVAGVVLIPLIWFYVALTGWPASAIRASVMLTIVIAGWMLRRPVNVTNSLFAAALVILLWQPQQLFEAGFQLSFFVVLCILLLMPPFENLIQRLLRPDPLLPQELRPRWQRILDVPARWVLGLAFASLAAWLGSIPLVAYYFHILTPVSTPANIVAVPLCIFVLCSNLASLLLAVWLPAGAAIFNHLGSLFMDWLRASSHWFASWPAAYFYVPAPSLFTIFVYYSILLALLTGWLFKANLRAWKITGITLLFVAWCGYRLHVRAATRLTVLPLNSGSAIYCDDHQNGDLLIDCGNENGANFVMKPYLRAQGVNSLPSLVLTCGEARQVGGFATIEALMPVKHVLTSPTRFRSPAYRNAIEFLDKTPGCRQIVHDGNSFGRWTVLYPTATNQFSVADENALVLRGDFDGTGVLLLSSLGRAGQEALLELSANLRADIVIAGLPTQGEPLSDALLDAIQPKLIVIVDSEFPVMRRASTVLQNRLAQRHVSILYTRTAGAVTITFRKGQWGAAGMTAGP